MNKYCLQHGTCTMCATTQSVGKASEHSIDIPTLELVFTGTERHRSQCHRMAAKMPLTLGSHRQRIYIYIYIAKMQYLMVIGSLYYMWVSGWDKQAYVEADVDSYLAQSD